MIHASTDRTVVKEAIFSAPVEKIWKLWTTNEGIRAWLVSDSDVELKLGGKFELYFGADLPKGSKGSELCTILSYAPEQMLSFTWNAPPTIPNLRAKGPCTWVVLNIESVDSDKTKLTLSHYGIKSDSDDWNKYYDYFDSAWGFVFEALKKHLS